MITISPGSTSRTNSAPSSSKAQVSEETIQVPSLVLPIASGRKPIGSRTATTESSVRNTSE